MADIIGTAGIDLLTGDLPGPEADLIKGKGGDDVLNGLLLDDVLAGGGGNDSAYGGEGEDTVKGNAGDDRLFGGAGDDLLIGGSGSDVLDGGEGSDIYRIVPVSTASAAIFDDTGTSGTDTLDVTQVGEFQLSDVFDSDSGLEVIEGDDADGVFLTGGDAGVLWDFSLFVLLNVTQLRGGAGSDSIQGSEGDDKIKGRAGDDVLSGNGGADVLAGGGGADTLNGDAGEDLLKGGGGGDVLDGGGGNDLLKGGAGSDTIVGEAGDDILEFDAADASVDGGDGTDTLQISGGKSVDLADISGNVLTNIEVINLGQGLNNLALDSEAVIAINDAGVLRVDGEPDIFGGPGSAVTTDDFSWEQVGTQMIDGKEYTEYTSGGATLLIGENVSFNILVSLASLNGTNGLQISGESAYDRSGYSVSLAGDMNGDGFGDVIVGAYLADPSGRSNAGASYVVFGNASGFSGNFNLSSLSGANGFQISGETTDDNSGFSVSDAGDVNGDGFDDIIIGAPEADVSGRTNNGTSYVVFGKETGFASNLNLSALNGANGFQIVGESAGMEAGNSVSGAGDVNGDGFADLIVGAALASPGGKNYAGAVYLLFGKSSGFSATVDLSTLSGANGFQISGENAGDYAGVSVSAAGDVNGDGFSDVIIGAYGADPNGNVSGASYVVFGKAAGFAANLNLSALNGTNGFQISGEDGFDAFGYTVSSAGDVNRDGFDDVIIGAFLEGSRAPGAAYVVFGSPAGFPATLELSALDGTNGFKISGKSAYDYSGFSVSGAGDVNGDGFADLIIGNSDRDFSQSQNGETYVLFGKPSGFAATLQLSALNGSDGFQLPSELDFDDAGYSVSSAGDLNGDGFDDLLMGSPGSSPQGTASGASYVVFGRDFTGIVSSVSTIGDDILIGTSGDDTLDSLSGLDMINGGAGDDALAGGDGQDVLEGGAGDDALNGGAGNDRIEGQDGADTLDGGLDNDVLVGGTDNDIFLFNDPLSAANVDTIMDFGGAGTTALDVIRLDNAIFTALADGTLSGSAFESGAGLMAAATGTGRIIYDKTSGALYYDEDGAGGTAAVQFAVIATDVNGLSAADFLVI